MGQVFCNTDGQILSNMEFGRVKTGWKQLTIRSKQTENRMLKICMNSQNKSHSRTKRSGFTLIELLVVISIIATLMSLILPAIQNAREAARRTQCLNNIRNVTMACMSFASSNPSGHLPALGHYPKVPGSSGLFTPFFEGRSWVVEILPFMDQQGTFDRWDKNLAWDDTTTNSNGAVNLNLASDLFIEALACPNDESAFQVGGGLSYVANCGFGSNVTGADSSTGDFGHTFIGTDLDWNSNMVINGDQEDDQVTYKTGVFWAIFSNTPDIAAVCKNRCTAPGKIYDGSTNTIMLAENINAGQTNWANPSLNSAGFMFPVTGGTSSPTDTDKASKSLFQDASAGVLMSTEPYPNQKKSGPEGAPFPSSNHPGVVVMSMCDGSAKTLSEDVDRRVYTQLITPDATRLRTLAGADPFTAEDPISGSDF